MVKKIKGNSSKEEITGCFMAKSGVLFFISAVQFLICIVIAEALYPGYSTANNYISDLGMTGSPAALLFNLSALLSGFLVAVGAYNLLSKDKLFYVSLLLSGLGFVGVGIFPGDFALPHLIAALIGLVFGGVSMILTYRLKDRFFGYISAFLGVFSLLALVLLITDNTFGLGIGGMERLSFYPILIWVAGLGGWLTSLKITHKLSV
ncbi:MAG: DUF998 domain-containing protein [Candidatus Micrarchaeota archaeon]